MKKRIVDYKTCPFCASTEISLLEQVRETLSLFKCRVCLIIFRNGYQGGSSYGYEESTFENWKKESFRRFFSSDFSNPNLTALSEAYREALMPLGGPEASGKVLDLGCGGGLFLKLLNELKYDAQGLEPSSLFRNFGVNHLGLRILDGDIYSYQNGLKFDTVILNSVLEHLEDPIKALREIRNSILTEGGRLIVTVPNILSLEYLTEGQSWHNFNEDHLWYFSERSMNFALIDAGFQKTVFLSHEYELSSGMKKTRHFIEDFIGANFNPFGGLSVSAQ
jgi:SAM-dependent methyltransferase